MSQPTLIVIGTADWVAAFHVQLADQYHVISYVNPTGYVAHLADDHAALIVVDGDHPDWRFWTITPKTSPATRRIPIVLVAHSAGVRDAAIGIGADVALTPNELMEDLSRWVVEYARVIDPVIAEQLDCECQEALPPLAMQAVEKFNSGEFYPQHDLFEEQWMHTTGPVRDLYRAVLQVGIAYYQIERGNHRGALKMLLRSVQWLTVLPDMCQGIDIQQLRADSYRVRVELERLDPADISKFDRALLKPVQLVKKT